VSVRLAHVSDLHFGSLQNDLLPELHRALDRARPDLVVVSGDLTQRARHREFQAARAFLDRLACDWLAVPGNHDVPAENLAARFLDPFRRYRRYLGDDPMPHWRREGTVVVGINSARRAGLSLNWAEGRVSAQQLAAARRLFERQADTTHRIVVAHHPFLAPVPGEGERTRKLVGRHAMASQALRRAGVDLVLAGHLHRSFHGHLQVGDAGHLFVVQAGTASSTRRRGQANAFHLIELWPDGMSVQPHEWSGGRFAPIERLVLEKREAHWTAIQ